MSNSLTGEEDEEDGAVEFFFGQWTLSFAHKFLAMQLCNLEGAFFATLSSAAILP